MVCLEQQSPNIADGVHVNRSDEDVGAGDQVYYSSNQKNCKICKLNGYSTLTFSRYFVSDEIKFNV